MSTISESIYSLLAADVTLAVIVGNEIWPIACKSKASTYLVYQRISDVTQKAHDGPGMHEYRYQFAAYSKSQPDVESIREALMTLLNGYDGTLDGQRVTVWHDNDVDGFDDETGLHSTITDFIFTR